jgi:hypothetical protein
MSRYRHVRILTVSASVPPSAIAASKLALVLIPYFGAAAVPSSVLVPSKIETLTKQPLS